MRVHIMRRYVVIKRTIFEISGFLIEKGEYQFGMAIRPCGGALQGRMRPSR